MWIMLRVKQGPGRAIGFKVKAKVGDVVQEGAYVMSAVSGGFQTLLRSPASVPQPLRVCQEERVQGEKV